MDDTRKPAIRGLPRFENAVPDDESLTGYAKLLRDIVHTHLYPDPSTGSPSDEPVFDEALRAVMERMIADNLRALRPAEFVAAYRSTNANTNADLAASLDALADVHVNAVAREIQFAALRQQCSISGRLRLRDVAVDEVLTIGLFDPHRPDLAAHQHRDDEQFRPLHRVVQVRTLGADGRAAVELLRDSWIAPPWANAWRTQLVEPLTRVSLGTLSPAEDPSQVRAELSLHAPLTIVLPTGAVIAPPQIVGYVETLDRQVLLDAP